MRRVLVLMALLAGCRGPDSLSVERWTLDGRDVTLPAHLDVPARPGEYTLTAHVDLPEAWRGEPLTLWVTDLPAIARLDVDGEPALATESPSPGDYRMRGPLGWRIPASQDGGLELAFTVEHRWAQSAWWNGTPVLVRGDERPASSQLVLACNLYLALAAVISLAQIALTSLLVFLLDRKRRAYLWFAVQCGAAAVYPLFILGVTQRVFGVYDAVALASALVIALVASIHFTHLFFDLRPPWRGWNVGAAIAIAWFVVVRDPFIATVWGGPVACVVIAAVTFYQLVVCGRLARRHADRQTARIQLAAWCALSLMIPTDLGYWTGLPDPLAGARPASLGLLGMGLCLSLLLGRRHLLSLRLEAEHLERARAEVEQLNVELRRQVAERSTQLFAALALAGTRAVRAPKLAVGHEVNGRYRVVGVVGRGGMGTVYEVERIGDGRRFALKLTHDVSNTALARLAREALIASRIAHPNLVSVIDVDVVEQSFLYVVMELIAGTSLRAQRARFGDPAWALPLLAQIADGLAALHAAGVVHRDLKPANVLVTASGGIKITDFGVSRGLVEESSSDEDEPLAPEEELETLTAGATPATAQMGIAPVRGKRVARRNLTRTGHLVGTPPYIAPELADGAEALSPAADLFAFGVLAWELIAATRPFARPPAVVRLEGLEVEPAPPLRCDPPEVARLIDRCLAIDPAARPTAAEASAVLARYAPARAAGM